MPVSLMLLGLIGSYALNGINLIINIFNNRRPIIAAINNAENDVIHIGNDIKDIVTHPSIDTINKDIKDISENIIDITTNIQTVDTIISNENFNNLKEENTKININPQSLTFSKL